MRSNFEPLESRRHFAAAAPAQIFAAHVNFTTDSAPAVRGYQRDVGSVFTRHKNSGLRYGWTTDHTAAAAYKPSAIYNDARIDSNIAMTAGDVWSIQVPAGWYSVHALMGQPGITDGYQRLTAGGQPVVNGEPQKGFAIIEGFATVHITNGRLELATTSRAIDPKLISVDIITVSAPAAVPAAAHTTWIGTSLRSPISRVEFSTVRLGTKIFSLGGFVNGYTETTQRFDVLDTKTLTFTTLTSLPGAPTHEATATDGTYIYAAGGQFGAERSTDLTDRVWRYDIARNTWQAFGKLPAIHTAGQLVYLAGKLHYIGGDGANRVQAQTTHWVLDLTRKNARWTNAAPMPTPVDHFGALALNGVIYAVGGDDSHGISYLTSKTLYAYDPAVDRWAQLPSLPTPVSHAEAAIFDDSGNLFVVGGQGNAQQLTDNVYVFNVRKKAWYASTPLPSQKKGGLAWIRRTKLFYLTGDDSDVGRQRGGIVGLIG